MSRVDVVEARRLRGENWTLQELGDRYGVSRERVRQLLGSGTPRRTTCLECGGPMPDDLRRSIYCSEDCQARRADRGLTGECEECGGPTKGARCKSCMVAGWEATRNARWDRLEVLWSEGVSIRELAEELGTTPNALGVDINRARAAGRDLPLRRAHTPKRGNLTRAESRAQFHQALRAGAIRRPRRCEGCGSEGPVDGHHIDYQRPLCVEWLCESCHHVAHDKTPRLAVAA